MVMTVAPTPITSLDRIDYVGSPKHIRVDFGGLTYSVDEVSLRLWVWKGELNQPYTDASAPNFILRNNRASIADNYIEFDLAPYVESLIDPKASFNYDVLASDEGVYYKYEYDTFYAGIKSSVNNSSETRFATLGYNWNYEGEASASYNYGSFGFLDTTVNKYYYSAIVYKDATFNISGVTNTNSMITRTVHSVNPKYLVCTSQPVIIIYLNKKGLWDSFSITGRFDISNKITRETYDRGTRNPAGINRSNFHTTNIHSVDYRETYVLNTGIITEEQGQLIEEILASKKIYLIIFQGPLNPYVVGGVTADSTKITADNAIITVDNEGINSTTTKFYQQPVVVSQDSFDRKSRYLDKSKISYCIKFDSANSKINNLR